MKEKIRPLYAELKGCLSQAPRPSSGSFSAMEVWDTWNNLSEELRLRRLRRAFRKIKPVVVKQLTLLRAEELSVANNKSAGHVYAFAAVKTFWENAELAYQMGRHRQMREFAYYPVRACLETLLRLIHFFSRDQAEKDRITHMEMARIAVRFYKRERAAGLSGEMFKRSYEEIAAVFPQQLPPIDSIQDDRSLDPFSNIWELCKKSGLPEPHILYFLYQTLAESTHAKLIATSMRHEIGDLRMHRQSMMLSMKWCHEALSLIDQRFLGSRMVSEIEKCVKESERIIIGPQNRFERLYLMLRRKPENKQ